MQKPDQQPKVAERKPNKNSAVVNPHKINPKIALHKSKVNKPDGHTTSKAKVPFKK